ncbi:MAG: HTH-type transcriptional repressor PurR [Phycisphaerae bacterium]|nr:HTH-type transcriptional repressor PurR [Phycisphaerae bacterium]
MSSDRLAQLIRHCYERSIPGTRLPGQAALARHFNCPESAVRRALDSLVEEGLLEKRERKGTFLRSAPATSHLSQIRVLTEEGIPHARQQTLLAGVDDACRAHGARMDVTLLPSTSVTYDALVGLSAGKPLNCGWIMLFLASPPATAVSDLLTRAVPFVVVDEVPGPFRTNLVTRDVQGALFQTTQRLIRLGHRRIALGVIFRPLLPIDTERIRGFELAHQQSGLTVDRDLVVHARGVRHDCAPLMVSLLNRPDRPTAVVGVDQYCGCAAIRACDRLGLRVPEDVSVGAAGLHPHFELPELNRLTCWDEGSPRDMGRMAVNLLLGPTDGGSPMTIWRQATLIDRGSVGRPPGEVI